MKGLALTELIVWALALGVALVRTDGLTTKGESGAALSLLVVSLSIALAVWVLV